MCQLIVLTKNLVPYEQFNHDIIFKVTATIYNPKFEDSNCGTNLPGASNQAVLGVLMLPLWGLQTWVDLGHCDLLGGH